MKKFLIVCVPVLLFCEKIYDTKFSDANKKAIENAKIKCRTVCDKKIYRQQEIEAAISFYKNSKNYSFTKKEF